MGRVQGVKERVHAPLYDAFFLKTGDDVFQTSMTDQRVIRFFVDVQNKTRLETNLQAAGVLPSQNAFEVRALRVVSFEVTAGVATAATALRLDVEHDFGATTFGPGIVGAGILDEKIADLGYGPADILRLCHQLDRILDWTEHDHAVAEAKFSIVDGPVRGGQHPPLFEPQHLTEPVNGGFHIAISQCWNDCPVDTIRVGHHGGSLNIGM